MGWIRHVACAENVMYKNLTEILEGRSLTNFGMYGTGSYNG
jgi:hypothetical protein